jgi:uncharacterized protein (DUF983 family)
MTRHMDKPCPDCGSDALYADRLKEWGPIHVCGGESEPERYLDLRKAIFAEDRQ